MSDKKITVLFILGTSYCGSTLLSYQMGSLKNYFAIGEINQWLDHKDYSRCMCASCGWDCRYLTHEYFDTLTIGNVYEKYSATFGISNLIDSSKSPWYFRDFVHPEYSRRDDVEIIPVVMFKHPLEIHASFKVRNMQKDKNAYAQFYEMIAGIVGKYPKSVIINYKDFVIYNEMYLKHLCELAEEQYDPAIIEFWNHEHHQVGGNNVAHWSVNQESCGTHLENMLEKTVFEKSKTAHFKKISCHDKWPEVLTHEEQQEILSHRRTMAVYDEIERLKLKLG